MVIFGNRSPRTERQDSRAGDQWTVLEMRLPPCVGCGSRKNVSGARRKPFQRLVHPGAQKRKTALKSSGRSLQSSETFVSELSFRASTGVTAQGTVASPARLPRPFRLAPDAGDRRYRTGASKSNSHSFFTVSICQGVMFSRSRPPDLVNSRSLHDWPKDRLLCPKDRIYFSSAKD